MGMTKHSSIVEYANPIHREEINISPVPWQATEATGREDITHPDDTHGGVLQPKWRTGSPWSLDHNDEEAKTEQRSVLCNFLLPVTHILSNIQPQILALFTLFSLLPSRQLKQSKCYQSCLNWNFLLSMQESAKKPSRHIYYKIASKLGKCGLFVFGKRLWELTGIEGVISYCVLNYICGMVAKVAPIMKKY